LHDGFVQQARKHLEEPVIVGAEHFHEVSIAKHRLRNRAAD
jgi:hypothetical protein